jgi:hypothetical protein
MQTSIVFMSSPVIPVKNLFNFSAVPSDYLLACTSDSCFHRGNFNKIVEQFKSIAPQESDVITVNTILFVSPAIAKMINENPELAPQRI